MADIVNSAENSETTEENEQYNPQLDFFSDKFDPLLALSSQNLRLPVSNAKKYDNLAAYKSAMDRENNPDLYVKKTTIKQEPAKIERRWKEHQLPVPSTARRTVKNVFTRMEKIVGPLSLLKRCVEEKLRIKIFTRNDREVRGYCIAYVVAFDKHFNMALEEVTEVWFRRKKLKQPAYDTIEPVKKSNFQRKFRPPEVKVTPHETDKKLENCSRSVGQLMMRGEHVVLINIVDERNKVKKEDTTEKTEISKPAEKKEKFFDFFKKMESKIANKNL